MILSGLKQITESLSATFAFITLLAIFILTWHVPSIGGAALVAFCSIVPAILAYAEHKETLAAINQPQLPPVVQTIIDNVKAKL